MVYKGINNQAPEYLKHSLLRRILILMEELGKVIIEQV